MLFVVLTLHLIIVTTIVINTVVGKFDVLLSITEKRFITSFNFEKGKVCTGIRILNKHYSWLKYLTLLSVFHQSFNLHENFKHCSLQVDKESCTTMS